MAPPYTRSTVSSEAKYTPKSPKVKFSALKRHSTLPRPGLEPIGADQKGLQIKPLDKSKPCLLATLPSELRAIIYSYVLPSSVYIPARYVKKLERHLWHPLLRICRAIRHEAAYTFYAGTTFIAPISDLNFTRLKSWVERIPIAHREFLSRNRNLVVDLTLERNIFLYRGSDTVAWAACSRFGNLYSVSGAAHRDHFVSFCQLAQWFLWCGTEVHADFCWRYESSGEPRRYYSRPSLAEAFKDFLEKQFSTLALPCVCKTWTRERKHGIMKKEALNMLANLDRMFHEHTHEYKGRVRETKIQEFDERVEKMRAILERW